eukprot:Awhi_evm1s7142
MIEFEVSATIPLDASNYWRIRSTPEFYDLEGKMLNNEKRILEKTTFKNGSTVEKIVNTPDLSSVPSWLLGNVKDTLSFVDVVKSDPKTPFRFTCSTEPSIWADKCSITTTTSLKAARNGLSCIQTCKAKISINIFGLGSVIENIISNGVKDAYSNLNKLVLQYIELYPHEATPISSPISSPDSSTTNLRDFEPSSSKCNNNTLNAVVQQLELENKNEDQYSDNDDDDDEFHDALDYDCHIEQFSVQKTKKAFNDLMCYGMCVNPMVWVEVYQSTPYTEIELGSLHAAII